MNTVNQMLIYRIPDNKKTMIDMVMKDFPSLLKSIGTEFCLCRLDIPDTRSRLDFYYLIFPERYFELLSPLLLKHKAEKLNNLPLYKTAYHRAGDCTKILEIFNEIENQHLKELQKGKRKSK